MKIGSLVRKYMLETSAPIGGSAPYGEGEGVLLVLSLSSDSDQGCNGRDCIARAPAFSFGRRECRAWVTYSGCIGNKRFCGILQT